MENIFTFTNLIEEIKKINSDNEQIIAFVYAPYHEKRVAEVIDQFYDYWNIKFKHSNLHFYWLGYIQSTQSKDYRWKIDSHARTNVYYDMEIFTTLTKELSKQWKFTYKDTFEIVLVKCKDSHIYFKEQIRIDLGDVFTDLKDIKMIMNNINEVTNEYKTFYALKHAIKSRKNLQRLKKVDIKSIIQLCKQIIGV